MPPIFPELPIVTPDPPRKSQAEKYGSMFTLGIAGLVVAVGLVGWFAFNLWAMRGIWDAVYRLHDAHRPEADRIQAAYSLARDPRVGQRQLYEMVELNRNLPPLARYLLAEALTAEAAEADPRAYALAVARSKGWPDWLRLLLVRPLAYGAGAGMAIPSAPLEELEHLDDPILPLWAAYARAAAGDARAGRSLEAAAREGGPRAEQARLLREALRANGKERAEVLNRATRRLRSDHPGAAKVWDGWTEERGRLRPGTGEDSPRSHGEHGERKSS